MTVESLIASAIADEVNAKLDPNIVKEIADKKVQRLTEKLVRQIDINAIVKNELKNLLNTYEGQKLIKSAITSSIRVTLVTE